MRTRRLLLSWSAVVLCSGIGSGCATIVPSSASNLRAGPSLTQTTGDERRQLRDSANAQAVADEVGPRVTVMADFEPAAGSRRVEATFHMYDDAYVIVGHLDAAGRLRIVFPNAPGDDGFVRGDKIYHVPPFFAGFNDEYAWRYSSFRYERHDVASRRDSYDAGLGYVFVIASWRPMRLDRISDGNRWESYEVSDISYMQDPREAIEELGSLIAGDNREAYTIEYAKYSTTNYGTYALSDFDAVSSGCYNSLGFFGFKNGSPLFLPVGVYPISSPFGFGSYGCNSGYGYSYLGYGYGYPVAYSPLSPAPVIPRRPSIPIGAPIFHVPRDGSGTIALHRPRGEAVPTTPVDGNTKVSVNGSSQYHRPGLIAEDAPSPRGRGRTGGTDAGFTSNRPTIQQMIGTRRIDQEARGMGVRDAGIRNDGATRGTTWSSTNRGGVSVPRNVETGSRASDRGYRGGSSGRSFGGSQTHATPRGESHGGAAHAAPAYSAPRGGSHAAPAPARSGPAPRASSGSSSTSSKKP
ncbi:MAG TPA: hypothetical protein VH539_19475 [Gemmatimonadaceae bacterium]|jgi:hypothetical protein